MFSSRSAPGQLYWGVWWADAGVLILQRRDYCSLLGQRGYYSESAPMHIIYNKVHTDTYMGIRTYKKTHTVHGARPDWAGAPEWYAFVYAFLCMCVTVYVFVCTTPVYPILVNQPGSPGGGGD